MNPILNKLEGIVNRILQQDAYTQSQLGELQGKTIQLQITDLNLRVLILIDGENIKLTSTPDQDADVSIKARSIDFIGLAVQGKTDRNAFPNEVELKGDVHLAQRFQGILQQFEFDWEEALSRVVGDTAARKLGNFLRGRHRWFVEARQNLKLDISEYLRFELEMLPDQLLINEFNRGVDTCRDDSERLQQRIQKLQQRLQRESD